MAWPSGLTSSFFNFFGYLGPGTDLTADALGDGLLEHHRAFLAWMDSGMIEGGQ